jgi:uncharacterized protein (TIGR03067 family)
MVPHALLVIIAATLLGAVLPKDARIKQDMQQLQSLWRLSSQIRNGKAVPVDENQWMVLEIEADKYELRANGKVIEEGTIRIDPDQKPKTMDLTATSVDNKGKTRAAVYELANKGVTLRICWAEAGTDKRPKELVSKPESRHELLTYTNGKD